MGARRAGAAGAVNALVAILVFLDCAVNVLLCAVGALLSLDASMLAGSWRETLSAKAHRMRVKPQPYWWWLAGVIDTLFFWESDHCKGQAERERRAGGAWKALAAT